MQDKPRVSVCTPVYNGGAFLADCIKGVLGQRYDNFEYVIVDNASTDATPQIIADLAEKDRRVKVVRNPVTVPVIDNFRTCVEHCDPDSQWFKFALADDYLYPNCLDEMVAVGRLSDKIGLVSSYRIYGSRLTNVGLPADQSVFEGADILKRQLLRQLHVCSCSPNALLYRRSAYGAVGGFDNAYLHADTELALRLLDRYDLGFAHCVFTMTGLHGARGETRSIYNGIVLREYLHFGFQRLGDYASIAFTQAELDQLADFYARQVVDFIAKKAARVDAANIRRMLQACPQPVKSKLWRALGMAPGKVTRVFVGELSRAVRGRR
jgi:glycosyltransferase involved in cell wall biosynthesis